MSLKENIYKEANMPQHVSGVLIPFFEKHDVKDKKILNLCYHNSELISQAFIAEGAKEVYAVSPMIADNRESFPIKNFRMFFENADLSDFDKFDVIFFIDTLFEFDDFDKFVENIKLVVKDDTVIYIMGYMPYTSYAGHLISTDKHHFMQETNPFEPWEHLAYEKREDFEQALRDKNISEEEIEQISNKYYMASKVLKYSPSEIAEKFSQVKDLYLYRIYRYVKHNRYYELAKQKYDEKDLDVERIILTTDFPQKLYLDELNIDTYLQNNLIDVNRKYNFSGKKILNVTPFINNIMSDAIDTLGVKEVVALATHYTIYELQGGVNVRRVNHDIEELDNMDEKFDIIYGLDVLEHVKDFRRFISNLIRLLDDNGVICMQGSPLWTSDNGHNFMEGLDCGKLQIGNGERQLAPWEHLAYQTKDDMKEALVKKVFSHHDAETLSDWVFNSDKINRRSFVYFIDVLNEFEDVYFGQKKILHYAEENEFYRIANKKYSHEELKTKELKIFIRKKV